MIRRPPRSTRTDTLFPTRRSSDLTPGEGFHVHRLTETEFRDLLELHLILLLAALATAPKGSAASVPPDQPYPDRVADLFLAIAERSSKDRKSTRLNSSH